MASRGAVPRQRHEVRSVEPCLEEPLGGHENGAVGQAGRVLSVVALERDPTGGDAAERARVAAARTEAIGPASVAERLPALRLEAARFEDLGRPAAFLVLDSASWNVGEGPRVRLLDRTERISVSYSKRRDRMPQGNTDERCNKSLCGRRSPRYGAGAPDQPSHYSNRAHVGWSGMPIVGNPVVRWATRVKDDPQVTHTFRTW